MIDLVWLTLLLFPLKRIRQDEKEDGMALVLHIAKETFCNEAEKK